MEKIRIRLAKSEDWPNIQALLIQVTKWLSAKGSKQWQGLLEGQDSHQTYERIEAGQVYIGEIGNELCGMFILYSQPSTWDQDLWKAQEDVDAYYLHRLAVHRDYSGKNLSNDLLDYAKRLAADNRKKELRLDCRADNASLNVLYQSNDFELLSTIKDYDDGTQLTDFNLYRYRAD